MITIIVPTWMVWLFIFGAAVSVVGAIVDLRLRYWTWRLEQAKQRRAALEGEN